MFYFKINLMSKSVLIGLNSSVYKPDSYHTQRLFSSVKNEYKAAIIIIFFGTQNISGVSEGKKF